MKTPFGQLTYCSNIHTGEDWQHHFSELQKNIPLIKKNVCPNKPFGIGLRLANQASVDLSEPQNLQTFQKWLADNDCYVFTMNGFPYGGFHDVVVKDNVHAPDWTNIERVDYTIRMFHLLAQILPNELTEGGISTCPLSYRFWWKDENDLKDAVETATQNMLLVVDELVKIAKETGKILHLDIEPEPDGILENSAEFINWYQNILMPIAIEHFAKKSISATSVKKIINTHIQLCYDICHFGVSYEEPQPAIDQLNSLGIKVGRIQISSAIKVDFTKDTEAKLKALAKYDEPTYLHQVVALRVDGKFDKYPDLKQAIDNFEEGKHNQWRVHFHVPLFLETYGLLSSTQAEIIKTLAIQKATPFTNHLEIETYTWGVLPASVQVPLNESIIREITWVQSILEI